MRILFVHPNYRAGAADIAGNWSPAWVAYIDVIVRGEGEAVTLHLVRAIDEGRGLADRQLGCLCIAPPPRGGVFVGALCRRDDSSGA